MSAKFRAEPVLPREFRPSLGHKLADATFLFLNPAPILPLSTRAIRPAKYDCPFPSAKTYRKHNTHLRPCGFRHCPGLRLL